LHIPVSQASIGGAERVCEALPGPPEIPISGHTPPTETQMASARGAPFPAPREKTSLKLFWKGRFWPLRGSVRGLARLIQELLRRQGGLEFKPDSVAIFKATQLVGGAIGCVGGNKITHVLFGLFSRDLDTIFSGVGWTVPPRSRATVVEPG